MKLTKAMEILELNVEEGGKKMPPDVKDALNLGIECMKWRRRCQSTTEPLFYQLLPGETREEYHGLRRTV